MTPQDLTERRWCTPLEAAHRLGLPLSTVERLLARGLLPTSRTNRHVAVNVAAVESYAGRRRRCGIR